MKKTYTVKKQKDGDYEVTLHNQTKVFSLKEVAMAFLEAQKALKEVDAQKRLDTAVLTNIKDHHKDVIAMFNKLPKVKRAALTNFIELQKAIVKDTVKFTDVKKRHDRLKRELALIHGVIPKEDKKLTKSEQRRINSMKK
jgi:hypothetical protein